MRVLFTGGGTGGHLFPAIAIAEEFKRRNPDAELLYIGNKKTLEGKVVPEHGIRFESVSSRAFDVGYGFLSDVRELVKTSKSMVLGISKAKRIIREFKPDIAIGTGGFVSFPVIYAAEKLGVKCYLHEQNAAPGRGNRALAKKARKLFLGFPGTDDCLGYPEKTVYVGNPVREDFGNIDKADARKSLNIPEDDFVLFTIGGSLGSECINEVAYEFAKRINGKNGNTIICGLGEELYNEYIERAKHDGIELGDNIRMNDFIHNMKDCIGAADLVVCRAGAISIAELLTVGRPAILVPYPGAVGEHQYYNAKTIQDEGGAIMFEQKDALPKVVCNTIEELREDKDRLKKMGAACLRIAPTQVAAKIYDEIMADYEKK